MKKKKNCQEKIFPRAIPHGEIELLLPNSLKPALYNYKAKCESLMDNDSHTYITLIFNIQGGPIKSAALKRTIHHYQDVYEIVALFFGHQRVLGVIGLNVDDLDAGLFLFFSRHFSILWTPWWPKTAAILPCTARAKKTSWLWSHLELMVAPKGYFY